MRIRLIAVGTRMPAWVAEAVAEYTRRLPAEMKWQLSEIPLGYRGRNSDLKRAMAAEGERMLAAIPAADQVVALEVTGRPWSTAELAEQLRQWLGSGQNLSLLIGGPDGLAPECLERARQRWSLSPLTLPHPLVRVVVAEQLYRAWSMLNNHPYHRS